MARYKLILRTLMRVELLGYRRRNDRTQEEMAEKLHITPRSYIDLEHGKYGSSTVTLLFFLALLPDAKMAELVRTFALRAREADENVRIA